MEPGGKLWESLAGSGPVRPQVYGIVMPWGVIHERVLHRHPAFMANNPKISDREARLHGAARLRAWIDTYGGQHTGLAAVVAGPFIPVWNRAIVGSPFASKVKLIAIPRGGRSNPWGYARRQVGSYLTRVSGGRR
jgi:hypothetical protein